MLYLIRICVYNGLWAGHLDVLLGNIILTKIASLNFPEMGSYQIRSLSEDEGDWVWPKSDYGLEGSATM